MPKAYTNSLYKNLPAVVNQKPHKYGRENGQLDVLARRIAHFEHRRQEAGHSQDRQYKIRAKNDLFAMIEALAEGAPRPFDADSIVVLESADNPIGNAINARLRQLNGLLDKAHFCDDEQEKTRLKEEAATAVQSLHDTLLEARDQIQPRRPRLKTTRDHYEFSAVNVQLYSPFVRAFVASAEMDRTNMRSGPYMFSKLQHLDYLTREAKGFCAMLDFSLEVQRILDSSTGHAVSRDRYWNEHRQEIQPQLDAASSRFDEALKPLHLKVRSNSTAYEHCLRAIHNLRNAKYYETAKDAHNALKHHAFMFVMGGEEKWHGQGEHRIHKLQTRIAEAYVADRKVVMEDQATYEHKHDADQHPYESPLNLCSHTLNRVYEARWAIAADHLVEMVESYKAMLANPDIRSEGLARPKPLVPGQVPDVVVSKGSVQRLLAKQRGGRGGEG